jgi:hypothetical protein
MVSSGVVQKKSFHRPFANIDIGEGNSEDYNTTRGNGTSWWTRGVVFTSAAAKGSADEA